MKKNVYLLCKLRLEREIYSAVLKEAKFRVFLPEGIDKEGACPIPKFRKNSIIIADLSISKIKELVQVQTLPGELDLIAIGPVSNLPLIVDFFRSGGKGFISYNNSLSEFVSCVQTVASGQGKYITAEIKNLLTQDSINNEKSRLTKREIEIFRLIKEGLSSREIATTLSINYRTVEAHRYRIMSKYHTKNTASLVNLMHQRISA